MNAKTRMKIAEKLQSISYFSGSNFDALQNTVVGWGSPECGFRNAQYLNHKFRLVEGETPAMWLMKKGKKENEQ